jgi:hypothetical protein
LEGAVVADEVVAVGGDERVACARDQALAVRRAKQQRIDGEPAVLEVVLALQEEEAGQAETTRQAEEHRP